MKMTKILGHYGESHRDARYSLPLPEDLRDSLLKEGFSEDEIRKLAALAHGAKIHGRTGLSVKFITAIHGLFFPRERLRG